MLNASVAEIYFIAAMFILIFIISAVAVYVFFRTYKREKIQRQKQLDEKQKTKNRKENSQK